MKIAIVGLLHYPIAEPFAGGMEAHTWWLAKKLIQRGHDVTLFASGDSDPNLGLSPCIDKAFSTPRPQPQALINQQEVCNRLAYAKVIKQIHSGQFDVVHNNALHPSLLLSAASLPAPMLMVLHTPPYAELVAAIKYANVHNTYNLLIAVAVSKSLAKEWRSLISAKVVYNGIEIDSWPFIAKPLSNWALWYGRIVPEKAPHLAIQAALKAGYSIQIAGPIGNPSYFEEQVVPLLKSDRVRYLGHLSHSKIKQVISQASVFVSTPMWEEPYGIVYAEVLASGTPVAAFDRGAVGEILDERSGVVVKEKTVDALAEAIVKAAKLSRQDCRRRAVSFCNIDSMITGYERLYRQLIQRHSALEQQKYRAAMADPDALTGMAT